MLSYCLSSPPLSRRRTPPPALECPGECSATAQVVQSRSLPRLAHPCSPIPPLSTLTSRATRAHPTSPRSTGFCAIWDCISSSSSSRRRESTIDLGAKISAQRRGSESELSFAAGLDWTTQAVGQQQDCLIPSLGILGRGSSTNQVRVLKMTFSTQYIFSAASCGTALARRGAPPRGSCSGLLGARAPSSSRAAERV